MNLFKIIIIVLFAFPQTGFAKSKRNETRETKRVKITEKQFSKAFDEYYKRARSQNVKSGYIRNVLAHKLPRQLCHPSKKIMSCHKISQSQCVSIVKRNTRNCLLKNNIRRSVSSVDGARYSQKIGLCVGKINRKQLKKYKGKCRD